MDCMLPLVYFTFQKALLMLEPDLFYRWARLLIKKSQPLLLPNIGPYPLEYLKAGLDYLNENLSLFVKENTNDFLV